MLSTHEKGKAETGAGIAVILAFVTEITGFAVAVTFFSANWVGAGIGLVPPLWLSVWSQMRF